MQQQMFTFFSGCFGPIYRHIGLPEPQIPTTQQLQFDPAGPPQPIGGFVQHPGVVPDVTTSLDRGVLCSGASAESDD
jgi:hypothetical protein